MTAVLAQMRGDAIGTCLDRRQRGTNRIRPVAAARVTQGCDVIDINSKTDRRGIGH
jgi:hypothetical protein